MKTKVEKIVAQIEAMDESQLIELNNAYCQEHRYESEIYTNDEEFFEVFFSGSNPLDVLQKAHFGEYNWNDEFVKFNGYGNLESFNRFGIDDLCELPSVIAEYIAENERGFEHIIDLDDIEEEEED